MKGILVDVIDEAIHNQLKIPVSHKGYPWARAQDMVKKGKADAFITVPTSERKTYTDVSTEPAVVATFTLFVNSKTPRLEELKAVRTLAELNTFKVGHYLGSGWAKKNLLDTGMTVDLAPSLDQTLKKLVHQRYEVFIDVSQVVRYRLKELGYQNQIQEIPTVLDSSHFSLCVGKHSPYVDILKKFDATMRKMREDGTLQAIYERYQ